MKGHRFVYEVARQTLSPWAEPLDTPGYLQRRFNPMNEDVGSKTIAIRKTPTPDWMRNTASPAHIACHSVA